MHELDAIYEARLAGFDGVYQASLTAQQKRRLAAITEHHSHDPPPAPEDAEATHTHSH